MRMYKLWNLEKKFHFRLVSYCYSEWWMIVARKKFFFILRALKMFIGGEEEEKERRQKAKDRKTHFNVDENLLSSPSFTVASSYSNNSRILHHRYQGKPFLLRYYRFHPFLKFLKPIHHPTFRHFAHTIRFIVWTKFTVNKLFWSLFYCHDECNTTQTSSSIFQKRKFCLSTVVVMAKKKNKMRMRNK